MHHARPALVRWDIRLRDTWCFGEGDKRPVLTVHLRNWSCRGDGAVVESFPPAELDNEKTGQGCARKVAGTWASGRRGLSCRPLTADGRYAGPHAAQRRKDSVFRSHRRGDTSALHPHTRITSGRKRRLLPEPVPRHPTHFTRDTSPAAGGADGRRPSPGWRVCTAASWGRRAAKPRSPPRASLPRPAP